MSQMSVSAYCGVFPSAKSRSVFPDLLPIEVEFVPAQQRVQLGFVQLGAFCKKVVASLPVVDLWVVVAMFFLASS